MVVWKRGLIDRAKKSTYVGIIMASVGSFSEMTQEDKSVSRRQIEYRFGVNQGITFMRKQEEEISLLSNPAFPYQ